ncbi:MAG: ATP-binding protein [Pseudomonadota bacterium]|nr:ATP-binding protein [Pseudomonadota bacterium]
MDKEDTIQALQREIDKQDEQIFSLNYLLDSLPGCIYWKDLDGKYLGLNRFTLDRLREVDIDMSREELINKTDYDIFDKQTADAYRANDLQVMNLDKQIAYEEAFKTDGKVVQLSTKTPLKDKKGNITGIIGNTVDISEKAHLIHELKRAKNAAEQANLAKTSFLRNMEHDIRTPLVGMIGISKILAEDTQCSETKELISDIKNCSEQLLDYCNRIFDLSKQENINMRVTYKKLCLNDLIKDTLEMFTPVIKNKKIKMETSIKNIQQLDIFADDYRIFRILINLIGNAVKFTQNGAIKVYLVINKINDIDGTMDIIVEDTGIGIPNDKLDYIFERFSKVNNSNNGLYAGIGLGLAIVKSFVSDLAGKISVQSKLNEGTTITCTIAIRFKEATYE